MEANATQFQLLKQRRFLPLFLTQFLGAFNDNVYKNALIVLLVFNITSDSTTHILTNTAAVLFILPFFLFSATAGQIADKMDKARLIRGIKLLEIVIMIMATFALFSNNTAALMCVLFMLGVQSAFFGPVKYSILPEALHTEELIGGNAQIEMGTFVSILLGTICGGLMAGSEQAAQLISITVMCVAIVGFICSRFIPATIPSAPELKINWNPLTQSIKAIKLSQQKHAVFLSILGISWFWLFGAAYLTQIPAYTKSILFSDQQTVTLLLCLFTIGVALGSLMCEKMAGGKIELGLVPFGSIGLSIFGIDMYFASTAFTPAGVISVKDFILADGSLRILFDLGMIGVFGGFYIVPLYASVQSRSEESQRARIISANNILNAAFMVIGGILGAVLLGPAGMSIPQFLLTLALCNIAVASFIYHQVPEFGMRFLVWLISHTMYRVKHKGLDNIPDQGGAIIVCNHVSYMDALLLAGAVRRPIRFIIYKPIYDIPVLNFIFRTGKTIPIISQHADQAAYNHAMDQIAEGLKAGDLLCVFPEGKLTTDGEINEFKTGIERIVSTTPVPVIPMALQGLWGSFFSHEGGGAIVKLPKRFWSKVKVTAAPHVKPEDATAEKLHSIVVELRGNHA